MSDMRYLDFDLEVESSGDGYTARVFNSPSGQATATFRTPFSDLELENFLLRVGRTRHAVRRIESPELASVKAFGAQLFNGVFTGEVRGCLRSSLDEASRQGAGLRVRLHLAKVPMLADLPWEFLYNETMNRFLGLSVETPLVRYLELPERIRPLAVKPPLRVLMMISSPTDYPPLDVNRESAKIAEALSSLEERGLVVVERQEQATLSELQRRLRQGQYHIFHFVGHGGFDNQAEDGVLVLKDAEERGRRVSAQFLGTLLHDHRPLRLAVLNACEGARASRRDPFAGTAQSLVQQGIPAVIAMQFEVTDDAAICFTREFYAAIAAGYPVDAALAESRKAIFAEVSEVEWGTPVLYMRAPDGRIFEIEQISEPDRQQLKIASLVSAARTAAAVGDEAAEIDALNNVLAIDPAHVDASARLGDLNRRRAMAEAADRAKADAEADRARRVASLRQDATAAMNDTRWADAIRHLEALAAIAPDDSRVRSDLMEARRQRDLTEREAQRAADEWSRFRKTARGVQEAAHEPAPAARTATSGTAAEPPKRVRYFVLGGMLGVGLAAGGLLIVGFLVVAYFAGRSQSLPPTPSPYNQPKPNDIPSPAPSAAVTPEIQAQLIAAVKRRDNAEMLAYRTLNPAALSDAYSGDALAKAMGVIQELVRNGVFAVNHLHNQQFDSLTLSPDGRKAEVRLTENWSTDFHSVYTKLCVTHWHQHDVRQTAFLEMTPQGWMIYASSDDGVIPPFAACH